MTSIRPDESRVSAPADEWRRVSPRFVAVELVSTALSGIIVSAILATPVIFSWWPAVPVTIAAIPSAIALLWTLVWLALTPRRVRSIGYRLREDDLLFRRGVLVRRLVAVPYGRMQLIDLQRGPLSRALGLAELKFVTAAATTAVSIPGLPVQRAEELRDYLVQVAESRRAGL